ncbi:MAG: LytR C-terminal domain-containing protein [Acidimicrobiaceae bacterium]|nr:LytR C-terminal domain-containing protein [Acidimicrobiaceae bacterium]
MSTNGNQGTDAGMQTVKAVVLIAVVVVVGVLLLHRSPGKTTTVAASATHHATAPPTTVTPRAPTTTTTLVRPAAIKVQVLNGILTGSLSGQWSTKLRTTFGYNTMPPDNATAKVTASAIYVITPGFLAEAQKLAQQVGLPSTAVNPAIPPPTTAPIPPRDKTAPNLVLVIGPELAASA